MVTGVPMHPFAEEIFKQLSMQLKHNKVYILEIYFINVCDTKPND